MKSLMIFFALCWINANSELSKSPLVENPDLGNIIVHIDKIDVNQGVLYVGLFDSRRTFRKVKKVFMFKEVAAQSESQTVTLHDVPFDEYALVVFQDYNENQKFDKTLIGLPKEPFGFSTNFVVKTRAPQYRDVTFKHIADETVLDVFLQTL